LQFPVAAYHSNAQTI